MKIKLGQDSKVEKQPVKSKSEIQQNTADSEMMKQIRNDGMYEDKQKRTSNSKHFLMRNGNYKAVMYAENVHYYNEEEKCYRTIDNTFDSVASDDEFTSGGFETRYNDFKVRVAANTDADKLVCIAQGNHKITWSLVDESLVKNAENNHRMRKFNRNISAAIKDRNHDKKNANNTFNAMENLSSEVIFNDVFENADIQYIVRSASLKENIILKKSGGSYEFAFKLKTENLRVKLSDDQKKIEFWSEENTKTKKSNLIFTMPKPVMKDAKGCISSDLYYDLENMDEDTYLFKIIANEVWLNATERNYPVTIDPMIDRNNYYSLFNCVTLNNVYGNSNNYDGSPYDGGIFFSGIGVKNLEIHRMYFNFNIPDLGNEITINSAKLTLPGYADGTVDNLNISAHRRLSNTSLENLTWSNQSYDATILDLAQVLPDGFMEIDLTEYFENIYYKGIYDQGKNWPNYGIMLKIIDESKSIWVDAFNKYKCITLSFEYKSNRGVQKGQSYKRNNLDRGKSQVNLRTGALNFVHGDISIPGNRFPVNVSHVYNGYMAKTPVLKRSDNTVIFEGAWKLNYQQFIIKETENRYQYIDGEGTAHYFVSTGYQSGEQVFLDDNDSGNKLYCNSSSSNNAVIIDEQHNQMFFESNRLVKTIDNCGNIITITYQANSSNLSKIDFGGGKIATFEYYDLLQSITCAGEMITFQYQNNNKNLLSKISYPGGSTDFTYTSSKALETITAFSGKRIKFSYKSSNTFMVEKIEESSIYSSISSSGAVSGNMNGESLSIRYLSKNQIKTIDHKNIQTIHNFDSRGRAISVFETDECGIDEVKLVGNITYGGGDEDRSVNCIIKVSEENLLSGGENVGTGGAWNSTYGYGGTFTPKDVYGNVTGKTVYKINGSPTGSRYLSQSISSNKFEADSVYVLSGFAWADSAQISLDNLRTLERKFELTAVLSYNSGVETYSAKFDTNNTSWQSAATAFKIKAGLNTATIYLRYDYNINSAAFDNIRVQKGFATITDGEFVSRTNRNDSFKVQNIEKTEWSDYYGEPKMHQQKTTISDINKMLNDLRSGYRINVRARGVDEWGAQNVRFKIKGVTNWFNLSDIEFKSITQTETETIEKTYQNMVFYAQPFYFARTSQGQTIVSNTSGVSGSIEQAFKHEIIQETKDGNYTFTSKKLYDTYCRIEKEEDIRGIINEYEYDNFGNRKKISTYHKNYTSQKIVKETQYTTDGNYPEYEIDSRNSSYKSKTTYKTAGGQVGLLDSIVTAEGQTQSYDYYSDKSVKSVESTVSGNLNKNSFTYQKGFLTGLNHNGLAYGFEYDGFGERLSVSCADPKFMRAAYSRTTDDDTTTLEFLDIQGNVLASNKTVSDRYGRVKQAYRGETTPNNLLLQNEYGGIYGSSQLTKTIDKAANLAYNFKYDTRGEVKEIEYTEVSNPTVVLSKIAYEKDVKNRLKKTTRTFADVQENLTYEFGYEGTYPDNNLKFVKMSDRSSHKFTHERAFDRLGRLQTKKLWIPNNIFGVDENIEYLQSSINSTWTTPFVKKITYGIGNMISTQYQDIYGYYYVDSREYSESDSYTYDKNGNIKSYATNRGTATYTYDGLNRLIKEINGITGRTYDYTYDAGGNILNKKVTVTSSGAIEKNLSYGYDSTYKDRLINFDSESISGYDLQGRPINYRGGTLDWQYGRLVSFTKNGQAHTFNYDARGIRIGKVSGGTTHKYYLEDKKIVRETRTGTGACEIFYLYGLNGVIGFTHKSGNITKNYYFRKNMSGDVLTVYGDDGIKYAEYAYDAWGNCTISKNTNGIADLNPFRYRSYYFDSAIGLYYLNTRYYDPEVGRFISQDDINYLAPETLNGLNLFAYCLNNPIIGYDPIGTWGWLRNLVTKAVVMAVAIAVGIAVGGVVGAVVGFGVGLALCIAVDIAMEAHYSRNDNSIGIEFPSTIEEAYEKGWDDSVSANAHQFSAETYGDHIKFVSPDGAHEIIFDTKTGKVVTDSRDVGTYNYYDSRDGFGGVVGHFFADVLPWVFWGNSSDDSTNIFQRIGGLIGIH